MRFFIALTVFITIFSIFKVIISSPKNVRNKNNSINCNVTLSGYPICDGCGGHEVAIDLFENGEHRLIKREHCNTSFYLNTYTSSSTQENDFTANFYYICKNKTEKELLDKKPMFLSELYGIYYYEFGYINFKNTEGNNSYARK